MNMKLGTNSKILSIGLLLISILSFVLMIIAMLGSKIDVYNITLFLIAFFVLLISSTYFIHLNSTNPFLYKPFKIVWFVSFLWIPLFIFFIVTSNDSNLVSIIIALLCLSWTFCSLYQIVKKNLLNKFILFTLFGVSLTGIILKHFSVPGSKIFLVIGWVFPAILYLFIFYVKIKEYDDRTNGIFNFLIRIASGTMIISLMGLTFKWMHWLGSNALMLCGISSMIICFLCFGFMMPNMNFIDFSKEHKKLFIRIILIPMIYLSVILILNFVFPEIWLKFLYPQMGTNAGYDFQQYLIPLKEGM